MRCNVVAHLQNLLTLLLRLLLFTTITTLQTLPSLSLHLFGNLFLRVSFSTMAQLRVRKLTLFTHGMACVDHEAAVENDATLTLSLPPKHMNDVLKTLSVLDERGVIESVTYDAPTTNSDDITQTDVLHNLLRESQGAEVVVHHEQGSFEGRLMGLQQITTSRDSHSHSIVVFEEDGGIVSTTLSSITKLRFTDTTLQTLLQKRLKQCALGAQARKNKVITIATRGQGERKVRATYAVESPVYKLTYRFLLRDSGVFVQAWAIVDNPSEEDLEDVQVVIVSGLPISFRHDLYNARYISRPVQGVPKHAGIGPPSMPKKLARGKPRMLQASTSQMNYAEAEEGALDDGIERHSMMPMLEQLRSVPCASHSLEPPPPPAPVTPKWTPAAEAAAAGSVHEYRVRERVTIRARESALLPLVMSICDGGPVDVYSYDIRAANTLRAVKIRNDTPAPFEAGPVAVYDEERLVGEGMLHACRPGKEELVPYCVNLECVVERDVSDGRGTVVECIALQGRFIVRKSVEKLTTYEFRAQGEAVDVIVMHVLEGGCDRPSAIIVSAGEENAVQEADETLEPVSTDDGVARYRVQIEAGGTKKLRVTESRLESFHRGIRESCTVGGIAHLLREGMVGKGAAERMQKVMETQAELNQVQAEIKTLEKTVKDVETAQARYRENVVAISGGQASNKNSGLVNEYVQRIRESETRIEKLKGNIEQKMTMKLELTKKISAIVAEFDKKSALA